MKSLKKTIGFSTLTLSKLNTLLVEVEGVLNTRIKNYVYDDEQSISYSPTPYTINLGELHLLRTVNIFRSLESITYLRKEQDIKKSYFSNSRASNGRKDMMASYARMRYSSEETQTTQIYRLGT